MGTDGTCVDGLVQGHMTMTDGVEWGGQTLADKVGCLMPVGLMDQTDKMDNL